MHFALLHNGAARLGLVYLGPEFIDQSNEEREENRAGRTLAGFKIGMIDVGASVGYSWAEPRQGISDQEGGYGSVHLSFSF